MDLRCQTASRPATHSERPVGAGQWAAESADRKASYWGIASSVVPVRSLAHLAAVVVQIVDLGSPQMASALWAAAVAVELRAESLEQTVVPWAESTAVV